MEIEKYLLRKKIKPHYKGFKQLAYAIELCQKDETYLGGMTTRLYPDIADDLGTTKTQVERALRLAIRCAGIEQTLSEFIARAVLDIKLARFSKRKAKNDN